MDLGSENPVRYGRRTSGRNRGLASMGMVASARWGLGVRLYHRQLRAERQEPPPSRLLRVFPKRPSQGWEEHEYEALRLSAAAAAELG